MDRSYNYIVLAAGVISLGLTALLVPARGALGMAVAFVLTEVFVTGALLCFVKRSGYAFWDRNARFLIASASASQS
jgi:O-antigen/teichoic acid export membrane protein